MEQVINVNHEFFNTFPISKVFFHLYLEYDRTICYQTEQEFASDEVRELQEQIFDQDNNTLNDILKSRIEKTLLEFVKEEFTAPSCNSNSPEFTTKFYDVEYFKTDFKLKLRFYSQALLMQVLGSINIDLVEPLFQQQHLNVRYRRANVNGNWVYLVHSVPEQTSFMKMSGFKYRVGYLRCDVHFSSWRFPLDVQNYENTGDAISNATLES